MFVFLSTISNTISPLPTAVFGPSHGSVNNMMDPKFHGTQMMEKGHQMEALLFQVKVISPIDEKQTIILLFLMLNLSAILSIIITAKSWSTPGPKSLLIFVRVRLTCMSFSHPAIMKCIML